jgi:hypothetical protein
MVTIDDGELVALIEEAIDKYVTWRSVNPDNVGQSVAAIIVQHLHRAGVTATRAQHATRPGGAEAATRREDHRLPA